MAPFAFPPCLSPPQDTWGRRGRAFGCRCIYWHTSSLCRASCTPGRETSYPCRRPLSWWRLLCLPLCPFLYYINISLSQLLLLIRNIILYFYLHFLFLLANKQFSKIKSHREMSAVSARYDAEQVQVRVEFYPQIKHISTKWLKRIMCIYT